MKNDALFYTCSLVEYIGRASHNRRSDVIDFLQDDLDRIYTHADVFHCEPIEKAADDFIRRRSISKGNYDNIARAKYSVPDYWDIGEVFARLVEDNFEMAASVQGIRAVMSSWLADSILNFNSDLYYQSREYLSECWRAGKVLAA